LVPASGNGADRFDELRAVWKRPWPEDDAADRRAFEEACRHASFEAILSGARTWFAAADDARYLPPLARWLAGACWEKPPPKRVKRQQRGGKVDVAREMLVRAGLVEDDDAGRLQ